MTMPKVRLLSFKGMFVTGVDRYISGLRSGLDTIGIDYEFQERKYWETYFLGKPVGGYASLLISNFLNRNSKDDQIVHAVAPMPLQKADVLTVHDLTPYKELWRYQNSVHQGIGWIMNLQSILNTKKIITPTNHVRHDIIKMCGKRPEDVYAIHEGVDTELFRPLDIERKEKTVLHVGDANPRKNLENLIRACARIDTDLVWIGQIHWKDERKRLVALAEDLNVNLTEIRDASDEELVEWYNRCQVNAYISSDEGFGLPLLEAASCGTLSVCSEILPFREIMRDMAIFVNPNSVDSIAKGLKDGYALSNSANGKYLREWASRFTWKKMAERTVRVYQEVSK